ncbi:MAG: hypothetical protein H0X64_15220 [Gemmatimonadaceae bacterium]|nr:hypothetical protein [Gemmatimonadaceae bacterium]
MTLTPRQRDALEELKRCGKLTAHATRARGSVYNRGFRRETFEVLVRAGAATCEYRVYGPDATYVYRPAKETSAG